MSDATMPGISLHSLLSTVRKAYKSSGRVLLFSGNTNHKGWVVLLGGSFCFAGVRSSEEQAPGPKNEESEWQRIADGFCFMGDIAMLIAVDTQVLGHAVASRRS